MTTTYALDRESQVWRRAGHTGIDYSDGDAHETYLLDVVSRARDVSSYSEELIAAIRDWPSEYHLTPLRHNLLRPFRFERGTRVLELGAGCGAMTRYLAESFAEVVSVEGSLRRAAIAAARCRGLDNVAIYCDRIMDFEPGRKFDYVFVIGVLEYAPQYGTQCEPVLEFLQRAASMLEPDGKLVVAIENRLGLKYFAGCAEDHHGIPFLGVSDLYPDRSATTFGRRELSALLQQAGLPSQQFHYPFPDYKLPTLMLADAALGDPELNVPDLLLTAPSRDYHDDLYRSFDEGLAWRSLHANGLVGDFANSFLAFAGRQAFEPMAQDWLAKLYNRSPRAKGVAVETTIGRNGDGDTLAVRKQLLHPLERDVSCEAKASVAHNVVDAPYIHGSLLLNAIRDAMAREGTFEEVAESFTPWVRYLQENAKPGDTGKAMLPGRFVDCVPFNVIREAGSDDLRYFDDEWIVEGCVPLAWIFIRGGIYAINSAMANSRLATLTHRAFVERLAAYHGLALGSEDLTDAARLESLFSARSSATQRANVDLSAVYDDPIYTRLRFRKQDWASEADRVKSTVSWRITAPLRALWNAWLRLKARFRAGTEVEQ